MDCNSYDECPYCEQMRDGSWEKRTLWRTKNFTVTPTIGAMGIPGYLLIVTNKHFEGMSQTPPSLDTELEEVIDKTRKILYENYSPHIIMFEHGPDLENKKKRGGRCINHTHLHLVPTKADLVKFLEKRVNPLEMKGFSLCRDVVHQRKSSYLMIESQDRKRLIYPIDIPLETQYIRKVIATLEGREEWNWTQFPNKELFEKTLNELRGKFD